jgi:transcriptional regulator with XRE-family HTH domain
MATRERRSDRARWQAQRALSAIGDEIRDARISSGRTQMQVGARVGLSSSEISRIERGRSPRVPYVAIVVVAAAVGLDVPLKAFPNGELVRDAGQLAVMARFRRLCHASLRHPTEVPLGIPGDRRAWDAVVVGLGWSIPVEVETRLRDTQALRRRFALKMQDGRVDRMLLVIADTRHNRHVLRLAHDDFAEAFPLRSRDAIAALRQGERPSASAIILL